MRSSSRPPGADFWLRLGRWAVMAFAVSTLALSGLGLVLFPGYAQDHYRSFTPNDFWTVEQTQAALAELDWPATTLAWTSFAVALFSAAVTYLIGLFFLWRRSDDWFRLYLTFTFFAVQSTGVLIEPVLIVLPGLVPIIDLLGSAGWQLEFIFFYLFPNGQFVPRWTRWMPLLWLVANLLNVTAEPTVGLLLAGSAIGSQVYRYGWRSTPTQRQQTKWLVAVLLLMVPFLLIAVPTIFRPPPASALGATLVWATAGSAFFQLFSLLIPGAIFIAVLRYRLWDIDVVIRKTLVYSLLTGLLALVYLGSVVLLQAIFGRTAGYQSPPVIVLSTLFIAALSAPLRRRVQELIDRRFFRRKYDAQQILAQFAQTARDEVEMDALTAELLRVVEETMRPDRVTMWLKRVPSPPTGKTG